MVAVLALDAHVDVPRIDGDGLGVRARRRLLHTGVRVDVPAIVPADLLAQANALDQFVRPIAMRMVGPALGGFVVGVLGAGSAFALDAASFGFSALTVLALRPIVVGVAEAQSTVAAVHEGIRFVRSQTWLWGTLLSAAVAYLVFLGPTEVLLPYVVKNALHGSAFDLGVVLAAGGVGALGAAALMGQRGHPRRAILFMYACWTIATLAVIGYGLGRSVSQLAVACLLFNALEAAGTVVWATIKQRHVPAHLLGRVSSLDWLISISLLPISYALTGPAAAAFGARATLELAGVIGAAVTLAALFLPGMRDSIPGARGRCGRRSRKRPLAQPATPLTLVPEARLRAGRQADSPAPRREPSVSRIGLPVRDRS